MCVSVRACVRVMYYVCMCFLLFTVHGFLNLTLFARCQHILNEGFQTDVRHLALVSAKSLIKGNLVNIGLHIRLFC